MIIEEEKVEVIEDEENLKAKKNEKTNQKSKSTKKKKQQSNSESTESIKSDSNSEDITSTTKENVTINQITENKGENSDIEPQKDVEKKVKNIILSENTSNDSIENRKEIASTDILDTSDIFENETVDNSKKKNFGFIVLIFITVLICLLLITFFSFAFYNYKHNNVISKGIYINSIDVSGLTKDEAKQKMQEYYTEKLSKDISLSYKDYTPYIKTSDIELNYDIDSSIDKAFSYGKTNGLFKDNYEIFIAMVNSLQIIPTYTLNEESLTKILNNFSGELPDALVESGYYIEDNKLIITKGTPGTVVNVSSTIDQLKAKLPNAQYAEEIIPLEVTLQNPKDINIQEIYNEVHKDPKDAYYTKDPFTVYPSETGIDFKISIDEAKQLVQSAETDCEIPLKVLYPNVTTDMIGQEAFPDLLGSFQTNYVSNADRTTNLRLAANKINGKVLMPGEVFSYNGVVGARTIAAGYKNAAIYQNGQVVDGLGGGICQISSTLFNAALFANLEIVELHNHQFVPSYVTAGRDATVVYGVKDFRFKNNRSYPIKITCSVSGGVASFKIWGLEEDNEYDVSVYANVNRTSSSIKSTTYRTLKQNGQTVKTETIYSATYKVH